MRAAICLALLSLWPFQAPPPDAAARLFDRAATFDGFLAGVSAQRERWLKNTAAAEAPADLVTRLQRVSGGLRLLIVAEDWCVDSVNTVPAAAKLAAAADVPLRIVDRTVGEPLLKAHRTSDGRIATPTIVLLHGGRDTGAWVERPAILQQWFSSMAVNRTAARQFADRQAWYDADRGRTTLSEIVALAEQTATGKDAPPNWMRHLDGVMFGTFNHQGGRRGATEFRSQNWMMGVAHRQFAQGQLALLGMVTVEPLTVGAAGYAELFQVGESYQGRQLTDHQHPHDLISQLAASWRFGVGEHTSVTIAGGPVGEASLGPVAFMHRASASENPTAPLSHHVFDSTHLSAGVVLGRIDRGRLSAEGSIFRGREPDADRYDLDFGKLDSWAARIWLRPAPAWTIQASHGFLHEPELLEPGDQRRTSVSASFFSQRGDRYTAVTAAFGQNVRPYSTVRAGLFEITERFKATSLYGRFERTFVETEILLFPGIVHRPHPGELVDPIAAATAGLVHDIAVVKAVGIGIGADVTAYRVPGLLEITHGSQPVSIHLFVRIARASGGGMRETTMANHPLPSSMSHHHQ